MKLGKKKDTTRARYNAYQNSCLYVESKQILVIDLKSVCVFHQTDRPRTDSDNSYSLTTHSL